MAWAKYSLVQVPRPSGDEDFAKMAQANGSSLDHLAWHCRAPPVDEQSVAQV